MLIAITENADVLAIVSNANIQIKTSENTLLVLYDIKSIYILKSSYSIYNFFFISVVLYIDWKACPPCTLMQY